jgi:PAS domain S-box-containing protein
MDTELSRALEIAQCLERLHAQPGEGVFAFDHERRYIYWGAGMQRFTGLTDAEMLGGTVKSLAPFVDLERTAAPVLAGKEVTVERVRFHISRSGRYGFIDGRYVPLIFGGRIYGGVALVRDVTDRVLMEQQMGETELRFRNLADAAPVLLWMAGPDSLCTFFNQTWLDFTGRTLNDEAGVGWAEGIHFQDFQYCMDVYQAAFARREPFSMEYRLRRRDGEYRWIFDQGNPRYTPDGSFAGYVGSCVDVTERKELEHELRQSIRARDEFLSIIAHELRTPLAALQLWNELLHSPQSDENTRARATRAIRQCVQTQSRLIDNLLKVSRMSAGPIPTQLEEGNLMQVVQQVTAQFEEELRRSGMSLSLSGSSTIVGMWDRDMVGQIVSNLVSNGIKYGQGKPLEVSVENGGQSARIIVRDQGIGIATQDQARIFNRFERAVAAQNYSGFGLGLWITRKLTEAMGGEIHVDSSPRTGSTFTVELPLRMC